MQEAVLAQALMPSRKGSCSRGFLSKPVWLLPESFHFWPERVLMTPFPSRPAVTQCEWRRELGCWWGVCWGAEPLVGAGPCGDAGERHALPPCLQPRLAPNYHSYLITGCFCNAGCEEECVLLCYVFLGLQSEFFINTTKAGPGTLSVTIEGPSKVKMDCQETPEGYKVMYTPMAPGNYLIGIKYGGPNHIVGSPFKAKVTGKQLTSIYCVPAVVGVIQQICSSEIVQHSGLDAPNHEKRNVSPRHLRRLD